MRKYLDLTSWILLFFFAPFTVLILLSQNTIPGDFFYPAKRGLENIVLVAYSVSPVAKVGYRTDLTQRRFTEAQLLLVSKADTTAYNQFIDEVSTTSQDLSKLSDSSDRIEKSEKLLEKIEEYKAQLVQVETQVQIAQALPQEPFQTSTPVQPTPFAFAPTSAPQAQPTSQPPFQTATPAPAPTTTSSSQTPPPTSAPSTTEPEPSAAPTLAPTAPPLAPTVTNIIATNPVKAEEVKKEVEETRKDLEKAEKEARKIKQDAEVQKRIEEESKRLQERREREGKRGDNGENDN